MQPLRCAARRARAERDEERNQVLVGRVVAHGEGRPVAIANQFVHAPHTGDVVKVSQLSTYPSYVGAVRP